MQGATASRSTSMIFFGNSNFSASASSRSWKRRVCVPDAHALPRSNRSACRTHQKNQARGLEKAKGRKSNEELYLRNRVFDGGLVGNAVCLRTGNGRRRENRCSG